MWVLILAIMLIITGVALHEQVRIIEEQIYTIDQLNKKIKKYKSLYDLNKPVESD